MVFVLLYLYNKSFLKNKFKEVIYIEIYKIIFTITILYWIIFDIASYTRHYIYDFDYNP